jgi:integrase
VFPGEGTDYLPNYVNLRRERYAALKRAGIAREHARTGVKRDFHSFRHTFARVALENGKSLYWLSRHLDHSSESVTEKHYGHFSQRRRGVRSPSRKGCSVSSPRRRPTV